MISLSRPGMVGDCGCSTKELMVPELPISKRVAGMTNQERHMLEEL